jgi:hypothetical protein
MAMIAVMGYSCSFCILLGSFGIMIGGMISGSEMWKKFWLGRFIISGSSVNACWCSCMEVGMLLYSLWCKIGVMRF